MAQSPRAVALPRGQGQLDERGLPQRPVEPIPAGLACDLVENDKTMHPIRMWTDYHHPVPSW